MVSSKKIFVAIAMSLLCAFSACRENGEPSTPQYPVTPDETRPWTYEISGLNQFPSPSTDFQNVCPVFSPDGSTAYFQTTGKNVVAVDVATGQIKWQTNDLGELSYSTATTMTQPAVNPVTGEIYVNFHVSKTETNVFFALDPATGRIAKKLDNVGIFASNISGPAVTADGKYVYIGTNGATLRLIDTETFSIVGIAVSGKGFRHALVEGDRCIFIGNRNEVMVCMPKPDAAPGGNLLHSEYIYGDDYYAVTTAFPCFSKDGRKVLMPSADADVFGGAIPEKAFVTVIDLEAWNRRNVLVEGARYVWNILSDEEGCYYVTATTPNKSTGAFVRKYSPDFSEVMWTWTVPNCFLDWGGGLQRSMPALGDDGNLYIVSRENNSVYRIDTESGRGAKVFAYPAEAYPNKAQTGINIYGGKLVSAFSGLRSGVIAVADIGVNPQKSWSTVVGDPCGTKSYEAAWGQPDQLASLDLPIGAQNAFMFDAKSNAEIRSDMLAFLAKSASLVAGTPLADAFLKLKSDVEARMGSEPYAWLDQTNTFVSETIAGYTPKAYAASTSMPEGDELARRLLLLLRDYPLNEVSMANDVVPMESGQAAAFDASIRKVQEAVVDKLLAWLDTPAPAPGVLELFKIYNMGYVARTANHCIGIDIYWWGDNEEMLRLADHIEALFVSHAHGDHFDINLMTEMSGREGKNMFMTSGTKDMFSPKDAGTIHVCDANVLEPIECDGLKVTSALGAQGDLPCQLWCMEFDGFCIWAAGDNGQKPAFDTAASKLAAPDLTMISLAGDSALMNTSARKANGGDSHDVAYVLSHENEVHHTIDGRVSYKSFFDAHNHIRDVEYCESLGNYVAMDYGEILIISSAE